MGLDINKLLKDIEAEAIGLGENALAVLIGRIHDARVSGQLDKLPLPGTTGASGVPADELELAPSAPTITSATEETASSPATGQEDVSAGSTIPSDENEPSTSQENDEDETQQDGGT